jgi:hypothetical protein
MWRRNYPAMPDGCDQTGVDSLDGGGRMAGMEDITWPGVAMLAVLVAGQALVVWIASRR